MGTRQTFKTSEVLRLEVEETPAGLANQILNGPDTSLLQYPGAAGRNASGWGWRNLDPLTALFGFDVTTPSGRTDPWVTWTMTNGTPNAFVSEDWAQDPGEYAAASLVGAAFSTVVAYVRLRFEWLDADGVVIGSSAQSGYTQWTQVDTTGGAAQILEAQLAPAGTVRARLRFDLYGDQFGSNSTGGTVYFKDVKAAKAATAAELGRTNLVTNPSFEVDTTSWDSNPAFGSYTVATFARSTAKAQVGAASLLATWPTGAASWVDILVSGLTVGKVYTASAYVWCPTGSPDPRMGVAFTKQGTPTTTKDAWERVSVTFTATATGHFVGVVVDNPTAGQECYVDAVMVEEVSAAGTYFDGATTDGLHTFAWTGTADASTSTSTELVTDPITYSDVIGPTHSITVHRAELNVGTLTAEVLDAAVDPSQSDLVRPGKRVRLMALDNDTATWEPLFAGKIQRGATTYDATRTDAKRARVTLTATDAVAQLSQVARTVGVNTLDVIWRPLEGARVPYWLNTGTYGITYQYATESRPLIDQVGIVRDSGLGYVWVDRKGLLQLWAGDELPTTVAATLDESTYSDLAVDYDTDRCINVVNVKARSLDATGAEVETPYGPYVDQASVDIWTAHKAEFTVVGITDPAAYAAPILAANATPAVRINSVDIPIRDASDIVAGKAFLDLYDLVTVENTNAGISQDMRPTALEHRIEDGRWMLHLDFTVDGSVAPPQLTSPLPRAGSDGWADLTLLNGWVNFDTGLTTVSNGRDAQVTKLNGLCEMRGIVRSGPVGTVICVLPAGFRPGAQGGAGAEQHHAVAASAAFGCVQINSNGNVVHISGSTGWVDLSSISYVAEL